MEDLQAKDFYSIQDAVAFNIPVDEEHPYYTDFSALRSDFHESKIYKHLNINPTTKDCNVLREPKKIFLSGYKGTGKTSELLKLTNSINSTKCYFSVFVDISDEELDANNIETIDILILMLEKLVQKLEKHGAQVSPDSIASFYDWYKTRIEEINKKVDISASIEVETKAKIGLLDFFSILVKTKGKLQASDETKNTIRTEFKNRFSDFSMKFNEFILSLKEQFQAKSEYKDILFIIDGFEKIGSLEDRKKILVDDANKFTIIKTHMIITLPIELFSEKNRLNHFSTTVQFPLVDLGKEGATERFKEFILKRVNENLFSENAIDKIIKFGAGHPRQTLQIISRAFVEADKEVIDEDSVKKAVEILGREMSEVTDDEIEVLKKIIKKEIIGSSNIYTGLKSKNIILDYDTSSEASIINPIVMENKTFQKHIEQSNVE